MLARTAIKVPTTLNVLSLLLTSSGSCSLVRVGYHSHVHKDVMPFLLESLVKAKIQEKGSTCMSYVSDCMIGLSNSNNDKELFDRKSKVAALEKLIVEVGHEKYVKEIEHEAVSAIHTVSSMESTSCMI